jgi:hypothetical protein
MYIVATALTRLHASRSQQNFTKFQQEQRSTNELKRRRTLSVAKLPTLCMLTYRRGGWGSPLVALKQLVTAVVWLRNQWFRSVHSLVSPLCLIKILKFNLMLLSLYWNSSTKRSSVHVGEWGLASIAWNHNYLFKCVSTRLFVQCNVQW